MKYQCEIQTAGGRGYESCQASAAFISGSGWLTCEVHASVSDLDLDDARGEAMFALRYRIGPKPKKRLNAVCAGQREASSGLLGTCLGWV